MQNESQSPTLTKPQRGQKPLRHEDRTNVLRIFFISVDLSYMCQWKLTSEFSIQINSANNKEMTHPVEEKKLRIGEKINWTRNRKYRQLNFR